MLVPCVAEPCDAMHPDLRTEHAAQRVQETLEIARRQQARGCLEAVLGMLDLNTLIEKKEKSGGFLRECFACRKQILCV